MDVFGRNSIRFSAPCRTCVCMGEEKQQTEKAEDVKEGR